MSITRRTWLWGIGQLTVASQMRSPVALLPQEPPTAAKRATSGLPRKAMRTEAIEDRVEDLLARMTIKEKVGQLNMPCLYLDDLGKDKQAKLAACNKLAEGTFNDDIGPAGGFFTLSNEMLVAGVRRQAEYFNQLQEIAVQKTRLKIPLLQTEEGTHGVMFPGATVFPEGLAIDSSWDMALAKEIYAAAAREARALGIHQLCTLVIEPNRDPRLGRNVEGFSEDPYMCAQIARAIVEGGQDVDVSRADKVVTVLCHFPGQSQPVSGLEAGAMNISERDLRETFLVPWVQGIQQSGALAVMATYPEINDVPVHSSRELLTEVLREELGFRGLVLSEGGGLGSLIFQQLVTTQKQAGAVAIDAGIDVGISYEAGFMKGLVENVNEGKISMALVDRAVRRVLAQKFRLGLFDNPYVDAERAVTVVNAKKHQELALRAAREGIVLLKNQGNVLPLGKELKTIAVIGPNADDAVNQLGDYSPIHNGPAVLKDLPHVVTVLEGIKGKVSASTRVRYAQGCRVLGIAKDGFAEALQVAQKADVAIVVVGEQFGKYESAESLTRPTNGEGRDVVSLDLTGVQEDLIKAVHATGTPTVVVLINGRPLSIRWTAENIPAIVEAWLPGVQGGEAVAEVLFGDYDPSGRLAITVPRHSGQLPCYYNYKPSKSYRIKPKRGPAIAGPDTGIPYVDSPATPLYEFGYGLSYTNFEYSNLRIAPAQIQTAASVEVTVDVKNTGQRDGVEVVQLYIHHLTGSVTTPVKKLSGFRRLLLRAGEKATVRFTLTPDEMALLNRDLHWVVEPGNISIMLGRSCEDIRLTGTVHVTDSWEFARATEKG
ncbi:MAG: glycoside hydrolase family 3 C-terminal domain-containing protein [Bryobacteraceae bacterium]